MNGASVWRATWRLLATLGIGVGMLEWGPAVALGCLAVISVMATAVALAVRSLRASRGSAADGNRAGGVVQSGVAVAAAAVGYWAVARLAPAVALLLLTLVLVTSPAAVRLVCRLLGRDARTAGGAVVRPAGATPRPVPRPGHRAAVDPPPNPDRSGSSPRHPQSSARPQPQVLDDGTLCRLWRQSFWDLTSQSTATGRLEIVAWRQRCLDEIERRDARALHAWLESGARASGGPEKFLRHPPEGTPDVA